MHTIVYYYIDILTMFKIKNMISTKYLYSAGLSLLFRKVVNLVKGKYEENISKQLRKMIYRKYVKLGIHRAGIYLENIHLLRGEGILFCTSMGVPTLFCFRTRN